MKAFVLWIVFAIFRISEGMTSEQQALLDALMQESLRSHRVQACDGEQVTLQCPKHTQIIIETGFYGRVVPESQLCPGRIPSQGRKTYDETCDVIQAHTRLSELCDKRRKFTITVDAKTFEGDPCPSTSKYLQMSYKCKPVSFDGESFCTGSQVKLECREGKRLAIYTATYGRTIRGHVADCPSPKTFTHDCTRDVLPTVLTSCHAKKGCALAIDDQLLGNVCPTDANPYLNILYMCVNEEIFNEDALRGEFPSLEKYAKSIAIPTPSSKPSIIIDEDWEQMVESDADRDKSESRFGKSLAEGRGDDVLRSEIIEGSERLGNDDGLYETEDRVNMAAHPPDDHHLQHEKRKEEDPSSVRGEQSEPMEGNLIGYGHDVFILISFLKENKEKVIICIVLSATLACILLMIACILQQCCGSSKEEEEKKIRYSIERSQLIAKSNTLIDGPPSLMEMGDIDGETFLRYSLTTPSRSTHYDF